MKTSEAMVIVEGDINGSVTRLWHVLTDVQEMRQWFFDNIPDFKPEVGFTTEFMVDAGERQFLHQWEVTEATAPAKLAYRWTFAGYAGASQSVFELSGDESASHLRISIPVEEDFPDDVPEFTRESCLGGWEYMLDQIQKYFAKSDDSA